jgi:hypothetical protein
MTIIYNDALSQTINTTIYVFEINTSTGIETLFHTNTTNGINSFTLTVNDLEANNSYRIELEYNHDTFGYQDPTIFLAGYRKALTTAAKLNTILTTLFGYNPLVWTHVIMFIILVLGMFFADPQDSGKVLMILGGIFICLNFILSDSPLAVAAGGLIPGLLIIIGLLIEWNNRKV